MPVEDNEAEWHWGKIPSNNHSISVWPTCTGTRGDVGELDLVARDVIPRPATTARGRCGCWSWNHITSYSTSNSPTYTLVRAAGPISNHYSPNRSPSNSMSRLKKKHHIVTIR